MWINELFTQTKRKSQNNQQLWKNGIKLNNNSDLIDQYLAQTCEVLMNDL